MRTKVKSLQSDLALHRVLLALEQELIDASDEEVLDAAKSLGMNPAMRGSAAFVGIRYPSRPQLSDFFEFDLCRQAVPIEKKEPGEE